MVPWSTPKMTADNARTGATQRRAAVNLEEAGAGAGSGTGVSGAALDRASASGRVSRPAMGEPFSCAEAKTDGVPASLRPEKKFLSSAKRRDMRAPIPAVRGPVWKTNPAFGATAGVGADDSESIFAGKDAAAEALRAGAERGCSMGAAAKAAGEKAEPAAGAAAPIAGTGKDGTGNCAAAKGDGVEAVGEAVKDAVGICSVAAPPPEAAKFAEPAALDAPPTGAESPPTMGTI